MHKQGRDRRRFLKTFGLVAPTLGFSAFALPAVAIPARGTGAVRGPVRLRLYHQHTREELNIVYRVGIRYRRDAVEQISHLLRDFRSGEVHPIDPSLLDLLSAIQRETGSVSEYEIVSGFRSPRTNAALRKVTDGVAENSLHMQGRAIDVRLTDLATMELREAALHLKSGGVGYYPKSNFVHLDTGRVRAW